MSGMVHLYHGNGKGKTTAALGLALRAAGNGMQVIIVQFLKGQHSGEIEMLKMLPGICVLRGKNGSKFSHMMNEAEKQAARHAHEENLAKALAMVENGEGNLLILDEAMGALSSGLLSEERIQKLLQEKPPQLELVFTGRNPPAFILEAADYVTEMRCEKHPYNSGVAARKGIEF